VLPSGEGSALKYSHVIKHHFNVQLPKLLCFSGALFSMNKTTFGHVRGHKEVFDVDVI
jgi:hypothetical protein